MEKKVSYLRCITCARIAVLSSLRIKKYLKQFGGNCNQSGLRMLRAYNIK